VAIVRLNKSLSCCFGKLACLNPDFFLAQSLVVTKTSSASPPQHISANCRNDRSTQSCMHSYTCVLCTFSFWAWRECKRTRAKTKTTSKGKNFRGTRKVVLQTTCQHLSTLQMWSLRYKTSPLAGLRGVKRCRVCNLFSKNQEVGSLQ
jgi:hypothetical protein